MWAALAGFWSIAISIYLDDRGVRRFENPIVDFAIAIIIAAIVFWATTPHRRLISLCVFVPIAFVVIAIVTTMIAIEMAMRY